MKTDQNQTLLKEKFLESAWVKDAKKGYIVVENLNLAIDPEILQLASQCWAEHFRLTEIDAVLGLPDAGSRLVSILAVMLAVGKILPAKRAPQHPGSWDDVVSYQNDSFTTGQKGVTSHIGFAKPGLRVLMIDDVIANGDTGIAATKALQEKGITVAGMAVLFDKSWQGGKARIEKEAGIHVHSLISIEKITKSGKIILR